MLLKPNFVFVRLLQCFLFIIGLSIGVAFCVCLKISFSSPVFIPIPSLLHYSSIPPSELTPLLQSPPPPPPLMQPPPQSPPPPPPPQSPPPPPPLMQPRPPPPLMQPRPPPPLMQPPPQSLPLPPPLMQPPPQSPPPPPLMQPPPQSLPLPPPLMQPPPQSPPPPPLMQPPPQSPPPPPPLMQPPPPPQSPPPPPPMVQMEVKNITSLSKETTKNTMKSEAFSLTHNMSDDELFMRASERVKEKVDDLKVVGKVAFMFLTPGPLPLAPLWEIFFKGNEGKYSIYIHSHPSYNESVSEDSVFFNRRIPSQPVFWGTISMIDAERRVLANALLDTSNQRFVLLSDSCIPVFNFTTIYNYLMGTNQSFLQSFDYPHKSARGRYNRKMWPTITIEQWRKGSQWFEIQRDLAVEIVSDSKFYEVFQESCYSPCYNDEHYLPTLVNILSPEMNTNRSITRVDWSRGGNHPRKFGWIDVNVELLNEIRSGSECTYNGNVTNVCFLFARKFLPRTIVPLLKLAPGILGIGP